MSMRLTLLDLSAISTAIEDLQKINQVTVNQIVVGGHTVYLDRDNSGSVRNEDPTYVVVGITERKGTISNPPGSNYRGDPGRVGL